MADWVTARSAIGVSPPLLIIRSGGLPCFQLTQLYVDESCRRSLGAGLATLSIALLDLPVDGHTQVFPGFSARQNSLGVL